jgi:hypothetical protein
MSTNIPGTRTRTINTLVSSVGIPGNAVAIIGNTQDTQSAVTPYTGASPEPGQIYTVGSFSEVVDLIGGTAGSWTIGGGSNGPYDGSENLLRAAELVYSGNPGAKVYLVPLAGSISNTTSLSAGSTAALGDLLMFEDIGYVVFANIDPISAGKNHVETAADPDEPYNSPRFYVTGIDLYSVDNDGPDALDDGLAAADLATWTSTAGSSLGLTLSYVGNHNYTFTTRPSNEGEVEIGGQYVAAYLAGVLSRSPSNFAISYAANGFGKVKWGDSDWIHSKNELDSVIGAGWVMSRYVQGAYVYAKGVTLTTDDSWELYTHRQIHNTVWKTSVANLVQFMAKPQTPGLFAGSQKILEGVMNDMILRRYVQSVPKPQVEVTPHDTEVDAIRCRIQYTSVKPVHRIYLDFTVG